MANFTKEQTLSLAAYQLAEEIRAGRWSHVSDLALKPAPACAELLQELERRCSGYSLGDYRRALANGLFETR